MTALALTTQSAANPPSPGSSQETSKAGTADFAGAGNAERVNGGSPLVADIVTRAFDGIGERRIPRPAEAENPRPQGDTWGERSSVAEMVLRQPVPRLPPASALNRRPATFSALQEWEGYVVAVTDTHMIANLVNLTAGSTRATEQADAHRVARLPHRKGALGTNFPASPPLAREARARARLFPVYFYHRGGANCSGPLPFHCYFSKRRSGN